MFEGKAEEAMNFHTSLFADSKIEFISRYRAGEAGKEGSVKYAVFILNGREFRCIDSAVHHGFTFTLATSVFVLCEGSEEVESLFNSPVVGGQILMPLSSYPFSKQFGWVNDRFGDS